MNVKIIIAIGVANHHARLKAKHHEDSVDVLKQPANPILVLVVGLQQKKTQQFSVLGVHG